MPLLPMVYSLYTTPLLQLQVPIGEPVPHLRDRVDDMDTKLSYSREVLISKSPLGGMKRLREIDTSDYDKELVPSMNYVLILWYLWEVLTSICNL
jgi:hypothetical protein